MPTIHFVNNEGGDTGRIEVHAGTTVLDLIKQKVRGNPENYTIRVDRTPVAELPQGGNTPLQDQQTVTVSPNKVAGAEEATAPAEAPAGEDDFEAAEAEEKDEDDFVDEDDYFDDDDGVDIDDED